MFLLRSDKSVVTYGSNYDAVLSVGAVERHVKGSREKQKGPQPRMLANYISDMDGVDLMDRLLSSYRPRIKSGKWWWNLFINVLNMSVVAVWKKAYQRDWIH